MILYLPIKKATQLSLFDRMQLPTKQVLVHEKSGKTYMQGFHVNLHEKESEKKLSPQDDYKANGVRSKAFKDWFGDWEHDPEHASKVVDREGKPKEQHNMQPITLYHGTMSKKGFSEFDKNRFGDRGDIAGGGIYFTDNIDIAKRFTYGFGSVITAYVNIKNPFDLDKKITDSDFDKIISNAGIDKNEQYVKSALREIKEYSMLHGAGNGEIYGYHVHLFLRMIYNKHCNKYLALSGYDGITHRASDMQGSIVPPESNNGTDFKEHGRVWVAFEPNQIKSVSNEGTFDAASNNIYKALRLSRKGKDRDK